ncbi:hypothetical protein Y032_0187g1103 [Ancylostoma ceylanicum]|uniref:Uncharacterized protein n=1 Tax=Ancylostoma ceylanicum TaxID=53326 RepID=A0A016SQZ9_9BILA|nr:hypothetical protein Y032_0187g1103 [Ancylostoma ceylanicum]
MYINKCLRSYTYFFCYRSAVIFSVSARTPIGERKCNLNNRNSEAVRIGMSRAIHGLFYLREQNARARLQQLEEFTMWSCSLER